MIFLPKKATTERMMKIEFSIAYTQVGQAVVLEDRELGTEQQL